MADFGFILQGVSSLIGGVSNLSSSVGNVKTSGWGTSDGFVEGIKSLGSVAKDVGGIYSDVTRLTQGNGFEQAMPILDTSQFWYNVSQSAQLGAVENAVSQIQTAAYSERDLSEYNARLAETEAEIIKRNGQLQAFQQERADKVQSSLREVSSNAAGFMMGGSPVKALLLHQDAVAEYGRGLITYASANQALSKEQEANTWRYKGQMSEYLASRQIDSTRMSAYYRMMSSAAETNAQRAMRQAELTAYGETKRPATSAFNNQSLGDALKKPATDYTIDSYKKEFGTTPVSNSQRSRSDSRAWTQVGE
jgi:hypothetical protein